MKKDILIILGSAFLVFFIAFVLFSLQNYSGELRFTGLAVYNNPSTKQDYSGSSYNYSVPSNATKETALLSLKEAEGVIQLMKENNFSIVYVNDTLIQAKIVFEQASYADILRGKIKVNESEKREAENALKLVSWRNISYSSVLIYTQEIKKRKDWAFLLSDRLAVQEQKINNEQKRLNERGFFSQAEISLNSSKYSLTKAQTAFREDRYDEAEDFLIKARNEFETRVSRGSVLIELRNGLIGFWMKHWFIILIILVSFLILGYFFYRRVVIDILKSKIRKMKAEQSALTELMKKTQEERFKENKISGLVYNIRMKKYEERFQEIKEELPVFEERLRRFKNQKVLVFV